MAPIRFFDIDAGDSIVEVSLNVSASDATISIGDTALVTVTDGSDGTDSITVQGTIAEINAALEGTVVQPELDYVGNVELSVFVSDLGNTDPGEALTDSEVITLRFLEFGTNDSPEIIKKSDRTAAVGEALSVFFLSVDPNSGQQLTYASEGALPSGASISPGGFLSWTPTEDQSDQSYLFQISVTDNGAPPLRDTTVFSVSVVSKLPETPNDFSLSSVTTSAVTLNWDSVDDIDGFDIQRRESAGMWESLDFTTGLNYTDSTVEHGTTYEYRLITSNAMGTSDPSSSVFATIDLNAPTSLDASKPTGSDQVELTWDFTSNNSNSPEPDGFRIERLVTSAEGWVEIADVSGSTLEHADDVSELNNEVAFYRVLSYVGEIFSGSSDVKSVAVEGESTEEIADRLIKRPSNAQVLSGSVGWVFSPPGTGRPTVQQGLNGATILEAGIGHRSGTPDLTVGYTFQGDDLVNGTGDDFIFVGYSPHASNYTLEVVGFGQMQISATTSLSPSQSAEFYLVDSNSGPDGSYSVVYSTFDLSDFGVPEGETIGQLNLTSPNSGDWAGVGAIVREVAIDLSLNDVLDTDEESDGGIVILNDDFDEENTDLSGDPVPDNEPNGGAHRIVGADDDNELLPATLNLIATQATEGTWKLTFPDSLRIWRDNSGNYEEITSGMEIEGTADKNSKIDLLIEGVQESGALNDIEIKAEFTPEGADEAEEDKVKVTVVDLNLDVAVVRDSVNSADVNEVQANDWLPQNKEGSGAYILVNNDDDDYDQKTDSRQRSIATNQENDFLPIQITAPAVSIGGEFTISKSGALRLFRRDGNEYTLLRSSEDRTFAVPQGQDTIELFVEARLLPNNPDKVNIDLVWIPDGGKKAIETNTIPIHIVEIEGARNVPGFSQHGYVAVGGSDDSLWVAPFEGADTTPNPIPDSIGADEDFQRILWSEGAVIARARYQASRLCLGG